MQLGPLPKPECPLWVSGSVGDLANGATERPGPSVIDTQREARPREILPAPSILPRIHPSFRVLAR